MAVEQMESAIYLYKERFGKNARPFVNNKPTKQFKALQKQEIRAGRSTYWPDTTTTFNPDAQGSGETKLKYDKRFKSEKRLVEKSRKAVAASREAIEKRYIAPTSWSVKLSGTNYGRIWELVEQNRIRGRVQMRVSVNGDDIIAARQFTIPDTNTSAFMKRNILNAVRQGSDEAVWGDGEATVTFSQSQAVQGQTLNQSFAEGKIHCVLDAPLREAQSHTNNKNWSALVNKILGKKTKHGRKPGLLDLYSKGVPIDDFQYLADTTGLGFTIHVPFRTEPIVNVKPNGGLMLRRFYYINTRMNHVEFATRSQIEDIHKAALVMNENGINISHEEITAKFKTFLRKKTPMYYRRSCAGISRLITLEGTWTCRDEEMSEFIDAWKKKHRLYNHQIDERKYPELVKFIASGTHFNMTRDFKGHPENVNELGHIDMSQAYRKFRDSRYYKGFAKISDFRMTSEIRAIGLYRITGVSFSKCSTRVQFLAKKLKWLQDGGVYWSAELEMWRDLGARFMITHGAWGSRFDLEMDASEWGNKTTVGYRRAGTCTQKIDIRYYCKLVGGMAITDATDSVHMIGDSEYFEQMAGACDAKFWSTETPDGKEMTIDYEKSENNTLVHVAAGITAYMRMNMLEQLLEMDHTKLIRICTDGIYYEPHEFKQLENFAEKNDRKLGNAECVSYLSGEPIPDGHPCLPTAQDKPFYEREGLMGVGGGGKTYDVATDKGLIGLCVVFPTRKAEAAFKNTYPGVNTCIYWDIAKSQYKERYKHQAGVLAFDEVSSLCVEDLEWLDQETGGKHIFMGDIGYQTSPFQILFSQDKPGHKLHALAKNQWSTFFDHHKIYTHSYRIKCDVLRKVCQQIRDIMDEYENNEDSDGMRRCLKLIRRHASIMAPNAMDYKVIDVVLADNNELCNLFTNSIKKMERWRVCKNGGEWFNGDIAYVKPKGVSSELSHASTIHSVQGETIEEPSRVMIITDELRNMEIIYTAISRARTMAQIVLIE